MNNKLTLNRYLNKTNKELIKRLNDILNKIDKININFIITNNDNIYFYFIYNNKDHNTIFYNEYNSNIQLLKYCLNNDKYFNTNLIYVNKNITNNCYIVLLNDILKTLDYDPKYKCLNIKHLNNNYKYCYLNEYLNTIFNYFRFKNFYE